MKIVRVNQRRFALVCAIVLVALAVITTLRESDFFAAAQSTPPATTKAAAPKAPAKDTVAKADTASKADKAAKAAPKASKEAKPTTAAPSPAVDYSYVAQPGDTYTGFVRQAISSYAAQHKLALTAQQQLEAEVALTNNAGAPLLDVGQKVAIAAADIAKVVGTPAKATEAPAKANADVAKKAPAKANAQATKKQQQKQAPVVAADVRVVAVAGDSYTTLARSAIGQYITKAHTALTPAQRVAAESFIVAQAGDVQVEVGQAIVFGAATLKQAVERATKLSADELALWQPYAAQVRF